MKTKNILQFQIIIIAIKKDVLAMKLVNHKIALSCIVRVVKWLFIVFEFINFKRAIILKFDIGGCKICVRIVSHYITTKHFLFYNLKLHSCLPCGAFYFLQD